MKILKILKSFIFYIFLDPFFVCLYMFLKTIPILVQNQLIFCLNCSHTKKTLQPIKISPYDYMQDLKCSTDPYLKKNSVCLGTKNHRFVNAQVHVAQEYAWAQTSYMSPIQFLITNFFNSSASILSSVCTCRNIEIMLHINPYTTGVIKFEFVTTWVFYVILQHYFNNGVVRISHPKFFDMGQEVNWLPLYSKCMPITPLHGLHPPNPPWPSYAPNKMSVAFPTLLALVGHLLFIFTTYFIILVVILWTKMHHTTCSHPQQTWSSERSCPETIFMVVESSGSSLPLIFCIHVHSGPIY